MFKGKDIRDLRELYYMKEKERSPKIKSSDLLAKFSKKIGKSTDTIKRWEKNKDKEVPVKYNSAIIKIAKEVEGYKYKKNEQDVHRGFKKYLIKNVLKITFARDAVIIYCYCMDTEVATSEKALCLAALAYFILPIDAIPDYIPIAGFADDAAMIAGAIKNASIEERHKKEADKKIAEWSE